MSVLVLLVAASISLGATFLILFIRAVRAGQYEDTITPAMRILTDEEPVRPAIPPAAVRATNLEESKMKKMRST